MALSGKEGKIKELRKSFCFLFFLYLKTETWTCLEVNELLNRVKRY